MATEAARDTARKNCNFSVRGLTGIQAYSGKITLCFAQRVDRAGKTTQVRDYSTLQSVPSDVIMIVSAVARISTAD